MKDKTRKFIKSDSFFYFIIFFSSFLVGHLLKKNNFKTIFIPLFFTCIFLILNKKNNISSNKKDIFIGFITSIIFIIFFIYKFGIKINLF